MSSGLRGIGFLANTKTSNQTGDQGVPDRTRFCEHNSANQDSLGLTLRSCRYVAGTTATQGSVRPRESALRRRLENDSKGPFGPARKGPKRLMSQMAKSPNLNALRERWVARSSRSVGRS